jgi:hypothetical protein
MKHFLSITAIITAAIFLIAGCEQFDTTYQRVDDDEFRLLDFIYEPADASPGDTITLTAVFAGKKVDDINGYIDWWISFNVTRDVLFGTTTVFDSTRLEPIALPVVTDFSPNTQAVSFKIPVSKDIMRNSRQIPERWTDILPASVAMMIPAEFKSMSKNQMIDTLESFLENPAGVTGGTSIQDVDYLPRLLQFFTVPIRVTAKISNGPGGRPHTIRSGQTIRYNRRLAAAGIPRIPVNTNPIIKDVVVYKVRGADVTNIENKTGLDYDTIVLDKSGNSAIEIENGYSYFLDALTSNFDTSQTMQENWGQEKHYVYRQFQLDSRETAEIHHSKFMSFDEGSGKITFPTDSRITKFTFWVTVTDEFLNELMRPEGSALAEVSGWFIYK